jgi:hypothetical protein
MKSSILLTLATLFLAPAAFAQTPQPAQPPAATQPPASTPAPSSTQPMPSESEPATPPSATEAPQAPRAPSNVDPSTARPAADDEVDVAMQTPSEWPTFEKTDANADGYINKTEAAENSQLLAMWADLDQDQNGSLSSGEYARGRNRNDTRDTNR